MEIALEALVGCFTALIVMATVALAVIARRSLK